MKRSPASIVDDIRSRQGYPARGLSRWSVGAAVLAAAALAIAGCGSSGKPSSASSSSSSAQAAGHPGGTFTILANSAFGVADPAQNYTLEEWQLLIDTHDGLTGSPRWTASPGTRSCPTWPLPSPSRPTAARPTSSTSAAGSSSPTARRSSPATSSPRSSGSSPCPGRPLLLRHRRREQVQHQGLQPQQGRGRQRLGLHADAQPDHARPGADGPALAAVRLRGAGQHLAEADRQQRPAGHRAVHVEVVQPEHRRPCWSATRTSTCGTRKPSPPGTRTRSSRSTGCRSPTR